MALNYIWAAFFILSFVAALVQWLVLGHAEAISDVQAGLFDGVAQGFRIALFLTGIMAFWLGMMRIGEKAGLVQGLGRAVAPVFRQIFPGLDPKGKAYGSMMMNIAANMLNLDNAATPLGLKAMRELQAENPTPETASNSQIMFLVLNTSGLTILPVTILAYRLEAGAQQPGDVFLPLLLTTAMSTLVGLLVVAWFQRINIFRGPLLLFLLALSAGIAALTYWFWLMPADQAEGTATLLGSALLLAVVAAFFIVGLVKRVNVYDTFVEGAKEGFEVAIKIVPFLVAMLAGIFMFRASGGLDFLLEGFRWLFGLVLDDTRFVDALPTAFMKPLSGSGARGMMLEAMANFGADSFVGRLSSIMMGSTETTFYVLTVYFGSVGIRNTRYALGAGLLADLAGVVAAIGFGYLFFG